MLRALSLTCTTQAWLLFAAFQMIACSHGATARELADAPPPADDARVPDAPVVCPSELPKEGAKCEHPNLALTCSYRDPTAGPGCGDVSASCQCTGQCAAAWFYQRGPACKLITQLVAGGNTTCVVRGDLGEVLCWGEKVGDGSETPHSTPTAIGLSRIARLGAGAGHICAASNSGAEDAPVWCWGKNEHGQLGDETTIDRARPTRVKWSGGFLNHGDRLALGARHSCAVRADPYCSDVCGRSIWCWGDGSVGQVGDGTTLATPRQLQRLLYEQAKLGPEMELTSGDAHTCAIKLDGTLMCWGDNTHGQLGDGTEIARSVPTQITLADVTEIVAGGAHTCARTKDGRVRCWGDNTRGQLGDDAMTSRSSPALTTVTNATHLAAGRAHTCAITEERKLWCWGDNAKGQLGDGTTTTRPTPAAVLTEVVEVAAGAAHTCARKTDGTIVCFGDNSSGQLGDGTTTARTSPTTVRLGTVPLT